ncbi:hypothetical protein MRX96_038004 [Rhipicephalus microplus]
MSTGAYLSPPTTAPPHSLPRQRSRGYPGNCIPAHVAKSLCQAVKVKEQSETAGREDVTRVPMAQRTVDLARALHTLRERRRSRLTACQLHTPRHGILEAKVVWASEDGVLLSAIDKRFSQNAREKSATPRCIYGRRLTNEKALPLRTFEAISASRRERAIAPYTAVDGRPQIGLFSDTKGRDSLKGAFREAEEARGGEVSLFRFEHMVPAQTGGGLERPPRRTMETREARIGQLGGNGGLIFDEGVFPWRGTNAISGRRLDYRPGGV